MPYAGCLLLSFGQVGGFSITASESVEKELDKLSPRRQGRGGDGKGGDGRGGKCEILSMPSPRPRAQHRHEPAVGAKVLDAKALEAEASSVGVASSESSKSRPLLQQHYTNPHALAASHPIKSPRRRAIAAKAPSPDAHAPTPRGQSPSPRGNPPARAMPPDQQRDSMWETLVDVAVDVTRSASRSRQSR